MDFPHPNGEQELWDDFFFFLFLLSYLSWGDLAFSSFSSASSFLLVCIIEQYCVMLFFLKSFAQSEPFFSFFFSLMVTHDGDVGEYYHKEVEKKGSWGRKSRKCGCWVCI